MQKLPIGYTQRSGPEIPQHSGKTATAQVRYQLFDQLALGGMITYKGEIWAVHPTAASTNNKIDANTRGFNTTGTLANNLACNLTCKNATDEVYYDALYRSAKAPLPMWVKAAVLSVTAKMSF